MTEYETLAFWPNQKIRPFPKRVKVVGVIGNWHSPGKIALKVDRILRKYEVYQTKVQTEAYNKWLNQNFPK